MSQCEVEVRSKWSRLCASVNVESEVASRWWSRLRDKYEEGGSCASTLEQIAYSLQMEEEFNNYILDNLAVQSAILFHNTSNGNLYGESLLCIELFWEWYFEANFPKGELWGKKVAAWLAALRTTEAPPSIHPTPSCTTEEEEEEETSDLNILRDITKAAWWGLDWPGYRACSAQIRRTEGGFSWRQEPLWCWARLTFLYTTTTNKTSMFCSAPFKSQEGRARENMRREMQDLSILLLGKYLAPLVLASTAAGISFLSKAGGLGLGIVAAGLPLARWILLDRHFIPYPYPYPSPKHQTTKFQAVVFAASFNPPHLGHLYILRYLASISNTVYAVIGVNPQKIYSVSPEERRGLLEAMLAGEQEEDEATLSGRVEVQICTGYVWRTAKQVKAQALFRGIRSWKEDGFAEKTLEVLNIIGPILKGKTLPVPTYYLQGSPAFSHISSSLIRQRASTGASIDDLVPKCVAQQVFSLYTRCD